MAASPLPYVLIADPLADQRDLYAAYLRWAGFRTDRAATGREAIEKAASHHPDVICAAFDLPDFDGPALCRALRTKRATSSITVILLATRVSREDIARGVAAGCAEILLKPVLPEQLLLHIRRHLPRQSRLLVALSQRVKLRAANARVRAADAAQDARAMLRKLTRRRKHR